MKNNQLKGKIKMKKMSCFIAILSLLCSPTGFAQDASSMSPEQFYLNQASAEKFGQLRTEAKGSFQGILLYPDDIRNSVLELAQYPELIALIKNKKVLNEKEFDKLLKENPAEVRDAIETLKAYPDVIDIMNKNIVVTALLGEMVQDKKEETIAVVKRLSDSVQQGHTKVVNAWTEKLQQDPKAVQELQSASEAYAKANNLPSPNQPMTAAQAAANPNPYGYYVNTSNTVVIQDMPSQDMTAYMLANQTMYMMLFSAMAVNYNAYRNDYYWHEYDEHHEDWQNAVNNNTNAINDLNNSIDENQANRDQNQQDRQDKVSDWKENHPEATDRKTDLQAKRDSLETKPAGDRLRQGGVNNSLPGEQPGTGRFQQGGFSGQRGNVNFQAPSRDQQINRASQFHSGSWSGGSRGGSSRGGGESNFSRGGGNSASRGGNGGRASASRGGGSASRGGGGGGRR